MERLHEDNIKCPYCDWEDQDSWEFDEDSGTHTCGNCDEEFNVIRETEITYSTSRLDCEEKGISHDYQFESVFIHKQRYDCGKWIDLPENEWTYKKIMMCSLCGDKEYIDISKEEYCNLLK